MWVGGALDSGYCIIHTNKKNIIKVLGGMQKRGWAFGLKNKVRITGGWGGKNNDDTEIKK